MGKHKERESERARESRAKESGRQLSHIQQTIMRPSQSHLKRPLRTTVMATTPAEAAAALRRNDGEREKSHSHEELRIDYAQRPIYLS